MRAGGGFGADTAARVLCRVLGLAVACAFAGVAPATAADSTASRVPKPTIAITTPGKCVEDREVILRDHMDLLKHQRVLTVHEGIRTKAHSLENCVACHASRETGRVTGSKDAFCESCHRYAAVRLDCFECHADRPATGVAANMPSPAGTAPR
ncbi:MAG: hypothetical protein IT521_11640 [Burkholderiales bacterium]|nr:hypothetical protein [Burkholderiales bacterium]